MTKFALAFPLLFAGVAKANSWYPSWSSGERTCKDHTVNPTSNTWLLIPANGYLEPNLQVCCERYFQGSEYNDCISGGGGTLTPTNKFYPAWDQSPHTCAKDCAEGGTDPSCGGILGPGVGTTYTTVEACCAKHFSDQIEGYCVAMTNGATYAGSNEWYLDASENICVKDCETGTSCGGVVIGSWVTLYSDVAACCAAKLPSINSVFCEAQSTGGTTAAVTNLWHVSGSTCKKDCAGTGDECEAATSYDTLYDTAAECCTKGLAWVKEDYCKTRSDPATHGVSATPFSHKWFVDYEEHLCKKDCDTSSDPACDTSATKDTILYDDAAACCKAKLNYLDEDTCAASSIGGTAAGPVGNSKWYADYSISPARCVKNCAVGAMNCQGILETTAGVTFYDDVETCCEKKFSWYNPIACMVKSTYDGDGFTLKFYADYGTSTCVMDCPDDGTAPPGAPCGGSPDDLSTQLFDTAEKCCKEKLSWINEDVCQGNSLSSTNGATHKWLVDYSEKRCVKDCAVTATDPDCAGIEENKDGLELFDTNELCCKGKLGYINELLCVARSNEPGMRHTGKFYPDQGEGVCKQDCPTTGGACAGAPTDLSTPLYDTAEACCKGSVGWVDSDSCQQISSSSSVASTDKYHVDYSNNKCVKDCAVNAADPDCDGIVENKANVELFATRDLCCKNKLSWINEHLCAARSGGGFDGHSGKFYADYSNEVCMIDCPSGVGGPLCGGAPSDLATRMYNSIETCCSGSLGWVDGDSCEQTALFAPLGASPGTSEWYVDWDIKKCVKDCVEGAADASCGGLKGGNWVSTHTTPQACCSAHLSYIPYAECPKS